MSDEGVITSGDKGKTWMLKWPMKAIFGPWFSTDGHRMMVVGKAGFSESTDGGQTWKPVAGLPPTFNVGIVGPNYAWDSKNEIFYASSMGKPTYRLAR